MKLKAQIGNNYLVENQFNQHSVLCDEPIDLGGEDLAMHPTALFLSAIASCKLITMKMVANRKAWELELISIELELIQAENQNEICQKITFPKDLDAEKRLKLI